jgi:hypothetical protein
MMRRAGKYGAKWIQVYLKINAFFRVDKLRYRRSYLRPIRWRTRTNKADRASWRQYKFNPEFLKLFESDGKSPAKKRAVFK